MFLKKRNTIFILGIILASFATYFNTLSNKFVFDDLIQVLENPWIRDFARIPDMFTNGAWAYYNKESNYYRPLMHLFYLVDYKLFGLNAFWFHITNVIFHAGVCVLLFLITLKILYIYFPDRGSANLSAFIAALVFAVHPIHTEAVAWVAGIPDISFSFFFLLAFFLYIRSVEENGSGKIFYLLSLLFFLISLLCKEPAISLPIVLVVFDYAVRRSRPKENILKYSGYFLIILFYFFIRTSALGGFAPSGFHRSLSPALAGMNIFPLFGWYIIKILLPFNLNVFHIFIPAVSPAEPLVFLSFAFVIIYFLTLHFTWKKERAAFFGLILFMLPLLPALYIPGLGKVIFSERYLYLPSAGFSFLLALFLVKADKNEGRYIKLAAGISLLALVLFPAALARNEVWKNNYTLWSDAAAKSPNAAIPHDALGLALSNMGMLEDSVSQFKIAISLEPKYSKAYENLGNSYIKLGKIDEAIEYYLKALKLRPNEASTHANLGVAYGKKRLLEKAVEEEKIAINLNPEYPEAHFNLGLAYYKMGLRDKAIEAISKACAMRPEKAIFKKALQKILAKEKSWAFSSV